MKGANIIYAAALALGVYTAGCEDHPDPSIICSISGPEHTATTATIMAAGTNTSEGGIEEILILENGEETSQKDCSGSKTCIHSQNTLKTKAGEHSYQAICYGPESYSNSEIIMTKYDGLPQD